MNIWNVERRKDLNEEFDRIFNEHERLKSDLARSDPTSGDYRQLVESIDRWEQKSIEKIHHAAQRARTDLQTLFDQNRTYLQQQLDRTVTDELRHHLTQKNAEYQEQDLDRWWSQLAQIRKDLEQLSSNVDLEKNHSLKLIQIRPIRPLPSMSSINFQFEPIRGQVQFNADRTLVSTTRPALLVSRQSFSQGCHYFRFRLERTNPKIFFGILSLADEDKLRQPRTSIIQSIHGWWNIDRRVVAGRIDEHLSSLNIYSNDDIILTLNCSARQITLEYPSMSKLNRIEMISDQRRCSSPWKILIEIGQTGESTIRLVETGRQAHGSESAHCYCSSDIPRT